MTMPVVNPGSGPVPEANHDEASACMYQFCMDVLAKPHVGEVVRLDETGENLCGDGRWTFRMTVDGVEHTVDMPGLPIQRVRWLGQQSGSPWDFPRLYVDGSSWLWCYAVNMAALARETDQ